MLKSCYFTPRQELINWINEVLETNLTRIEQLGAGNIYCQLLDAAYPSKVPLHKVKWKAVLEIDFIYNFKILQNCFDHLGIEKYIDVQCFSHRFKNLSKLSIKIIFSSRSG